MESFLLLLTLRDNTREGSEWEAHIKDSLLQEKKLIEYLTKSQERANEDKILQYFRDLYPKFTRQKEAKGADGYVPGHFVLELKGKKK